MPHKPTNKNQTAQVVPVAGIGGKSHPVTEPGFLAAQVLAIAAETGWARGADCCSFRWRGSSNTSHCLLRHNGGRACWSSSGGGANQLAGAIGVAAERLWGMPRYTLSLGASASDLILDGYRITVARSPATVTATTRDNPAPPALATQNAENGSSPRVTNSPTATPVNLRGETTGAPVKITKRKLSIRLNAYAPASSALQ